MTGPILHYSQVRSQPASGDKQKDAEQGEDEAEGELGGEDVALRPARHLRGIGASGGEHEDRDEGRDEICFRDTVSVADSDGAMSMAESEASAPQHPFTCATATGNVETFWISMDFDAPSPAAISPKATPSGGTASLGAAWTEEVWMETTKHTKYTRAPVAFFRVLRVFRGFTSPFGVCFLVLFPIDASLFFNSFDRRLGGGRVARPHCLGIGCGFRGHGFYVNHGGRCGL